MSHNKKCIGGCDGGKVVTEIDGRKYCLGCLVGAYILNTNALRHQKEKVAELLTELEVLRERHGS